MLKNNNQEVLRRLSRRSMKAERTRNFFAVLAIILTTFMFTSVFSIGVSLIQNLGIMQIRNLGSQSTIWLEQPSKQQMDQIRKMQDLQAMGVQVSAGSRKEASGEKTVALWYYDTAEYQKNFIPAISRIHGTYPEKQDEIMMSETSLAVAGVKKPEIGEKVTLYDGDREETFTLSGWYRDYIYGKAVSLVSKKYVQKMGLDKRENKTLSISAKRGMKYILYKKLQNQVSMDQIMAENGVKRTQAWESSFSEDQNNAGERLVVVAVLLAVGVIIILSGYLLIYNVMYISVTKDIRFYGMLKTIGTTPLQIQKLVKKQVWHLAGIGIPAGIFLGVVCAFGIVPAALHALAVGGNDAMPGRIQFRPEIFVATVLFSLVTIWISCRKPAKFAGNISAVEAMKYNGQYQEKLRSHHTKRGGKIRRMAFRNVFRDKKRAIFVFASLFMGMIAFLAVDTILGSIKLENYLETYVPNDYVIYTGTDENNEQMKKQKRSLETMAGELQKIPGITSFRWNRTADIVLPFDEKLYKPFLDTDQMIAQEREESIKFYRRAQEKKNKKSMYSCPVISIGKDDIRKYNERAEKDQRIDEKAFEEGEICLIGTVDTKEQAQQMKGKTLTLVERKTDKESTIKVGACLTSMEGFEIGYYWMSIGAPEAILVSDKAISRITDDPGSDNMILNCRKEAEASVTKRVKELVKSNTAVVNTTIKSEAAKEFSTSIMTMKILGGGISGILIMIGVLNYINVMLTGVFTRRTELAVMESVGMTKKQVCRMLLWEGGYYGLISMGLLLTFGNVIIFLFARAAKTMADYAIFHYPAGVMAGIAVVSLVICMIVPAVVYYMISKESVVQRMRREG